MSARPPAGGRRLLVLPSGRSRSLLPDTRVAVVCALFSTVALLTAALSLGLGSFPVGVPDVIAALFGDGRRAVHVVVVDWRLPRALMTVLLGAALGVAGAIFQSLTRNPLGSPDVIGFGSGSHTGALVVILLGGGGYPQVAFGALIGGITTAAVVYLLAYRGGVFGFRLILVGIGVSALFGSVNTWLILTADLGSAMSAAIWGAGSFNGVGWDAALQATVVLAVLFPLVTALSRPLRQLELGDDLARATGVSAGRVRLLAVLVGLAFQATVTAMVGPVAFVALAAPQVARMLAPRSGLSFAGAATMGAAMLAVADLIARQLFAPIQLPVGVVTVAAGGSYLIVMLVRRARPG